jgi:hypothetical protein
MIEKEVMAEVRTQRLAAFKSFFHKVVSMQPEHLTELPAYTLSLQKPEGFRAKAPRVQP